MTPKDASERQHALVRKRESGESAWRRRWSQARLVWQWPGSLGEPQLRSTVAADVTHPRRDPDPTGKQRGCSHGGMNLGAASGYRGRSARPGLCR